MKLTIKGTLQEIADKLRELIAELGEEATVAEAILWGRL